MHELEMERNLDLKADEEESTSEVRMKSQGVERRRSFIFRKSAWL